MQPTAKESPCPWLNGYVAATLAALRADGIQPADAEIAWLVELRWRCDRPDFREGIAPPRGFPLIIETMPDVEFWPLHALAETWFRMAGEIVPDLRTDVYLYAHTRAGPGDTSLAALQVEAAIRETLGAWRGGLPLHAENEPALVRLCRLIDGYVQPDVLAPGQAAPQEEDAGDVDARCVRMLCEAMPGTTPTYWRTEISVAEMDALMRARNREPWAESAKRGAAIENYLNDVRWIRHARGKG
jgi:hypothetical protein